MSNEQSTELGAAIDALYAIREHRLGLQRKVDELKGEEVKARERLFEMLTAIGLTKASGAVATAGIKISKIPLVEDVDISLTKASRGS